VPLSGLDTSDGGLQVLAVVASSMQDPRDIFSFATASKQLLAALAEAAVHLQLNPALVEKLTIPSNSSMLLQVVGSLAKYIKGG
jgi:hypothetical protein